ncbi:RAQPRD family integrative conjugative element protein [Klebsiella pneumoniae]|uniref:integrative conjugative element protein, RAQPRD family n=1 Tax=Klebsiella pneumoniae TaxID=573 RepID=UPI001ABC864E|nr:RAQPRD family integrative conjugative element protein [Klebsiella pneumoniae]MBO3721249.1 RAQPRD family integrative conjugative element protein [Klebsiella pneumoniae]HCM5830629.1 RAQPRD family integrative conjugative element protein [Klebsiella pneumoniae]
MVLPIRLRATYCGASLSLCVALIPGMPLATRADTPAQHQEMTAALRQLDALERFIAQSASNAPTVPGEQRYHFDYPRLLSDLARVRAGIQSHLSPSRAQPRDPTELSGNYRLESAAGHGNTSVEGKP